ncbi:MAG TPA: protein-disulfide reductase DsbD domain-containing protein, partial [Opitutus sp.]|nr:protein-disulfide reductase DsbD domain-containing protein [Opitutus sp.]
MKLSRSLFQEPLKFCLFFLLGFAAMASVARAQVTASLVAADQAIQPGKAFTVALRLVHEPHWHTYWINPGTGLATELDWKLPAGFTAGEIQWPPPIPIKDRTGAVVGNGYEGEAFLLVTITPPATLPPGQEIELKADASWLMCADVCIPGNGQVALTLPVSAEAPQLNPQWSQKIAVTAAEIPRALSEWEVAAARTADTVSLSVRPRDGSGGHAPKDLHFFSDDGLIAYELPQPAEKNSEGGYTLTLPISPDGPTDAARLLGVLTSSNGWRKDGSFHGMRVDVAFGEQAKSNAAAAASTARASGANGTGTGTSAAASAATSTSLIGTLLLALAGGLILNLMPCVFPVLGIKILGFVNQAGHARSKVIAHGLVF